eukprot:TRINITY_DN8559_c0_g1_i1.p3 TRINITY_DN8559_c0_g1~~TRINITY_DN8559_c0_g1_i1.p3  ORF type:complete len:127 (-),score=8.74 TRINITY_DN8559_c0_g1_i1:66-413(-)
MAMLRSMNRGRLPYVLLFACICISLAVAFLLFVAHTIHSAHDTQRTQYTAHTIHSAHNTQRTQYTAHTIHSAHNTQRTQYTAHKYMRACSERAGQEEVVGNFESSVANASGKVVF